MKRLSDFVDSPLEWTQPAAMQSAYELRAGDEGVLAKLIFRNSWGSFATGEAAGARWTFKRQGFFNPTATVRTEGGEKELAVFRNRTWTGGGTIDLADDRHLLVSSNFWHTKYEISTPSETTLISFARTKGIIHLSAEMRIHPAAAAMPELPWLALLGWYLKVLLYRDSAAAAAG